MMSVLEEHIKIIYNKLQQLGMHYQQLQKENKDLELTLQLLRLNNENKREELNLLQQQVLLLKSSIGKMEEPEKMAFEKLLNQYIKEIDKCINLMGE